MTTDFTPGEPDAIVQDGGFIATGDDIQGDADLRELTAIAADVVGMEHDDAKRLIHAFLNEIQAQTAKRGYVTLHGFGSFSIKELAPDSGNDPHGNPFNVGKRLTAEFNPFAEFRKAISDATGLPAIR